MGENKLINVIKIFVNKIMTQLKYEMQIQKIQTMRLQSVIQMDRFVEGKYTSGHCPSGERSLTMAVAVKSEGQWP